jgi:SulP family sulfate permease
MSEGALVGLIGATALGCGIVGGVFFAFSSFVMTALGRLPAAEGMAAMRSINRVAVTPPFMAALLFLHRMAQAVEIESGRPSLEEDQADTVGSNARQPYDFGMAADPDVMVYRISGAFFFGAAATVGSVLDQLAEHPKAYVLDVSEVPMLDSTAAITIEGFVRKAHGKGASVYIAGAQRPIRRALLTHGVRPPRVRFRSTVADAIEDAHARASTPRIAPATVEA